MFDVVAVGEVLIDFSPVNFGHTSSLEQSTYPTFQANPGGAPANVVAGLSKLGMKTAIIAKVGDDPFGTLIHDTLRKLNVNTESLMKDASVNTTLAFVHIAEQGERTFSFFRKPGADTQLNVNEIDFGMIENTRILHFGSVSLTHEPSRTATLQAVKHAKAYGVIVSFDPNVRERLWDDLNEAREIILSAMEYADIVKLSEEELYFLMEREDMEGTAKEFVRRFGPQFMLITKGKQGCYFTTGAKEGTVPGFQVNTVDTTGAGDCFMSAILYQLLQYDVHCENLSFENFEDIVRFANASAGLSTTKSGAIPSIPTLSEIKSVMNSNT